MKKAGFGSGRSIATTKLDIVKGENGKYGVRKNDEMVVPFEYDYIQDEYFNSRTYIKAQKDGKWGTIAIDDFSLDIPFMYDEEIGFNHRDLAEAKKDGKLGIINENNDVILPFEYDYLGDFRAIVKNEKMYVTKNGRNGIINASNFNVIIPTMYGEHLFFIDGIAAVEKDGKYGIINEKNKTKKGRRNCCPHKS